MRFAVIAPMRNEGAFIVEWVCWYRMLGFTDIVIPTNDCTDHSPALLDVLAARGWVTHLPHAPAPGKPPAASALATARRCPQVAQADWTMICDVDEFLVIHRDNGRISDLLPDPDPDFLGMAINWRVFGTGGNAAYADGLVHQQFQRAAPGDHRVNCWIKSVFRKPDQYLRLGVHGPTRIKPDPVLTAAGTDALRWVDTAGRTIDAWGPGTPELRRIPLEQITHAAAQLNHYMIRSSESFAAKRGTPSSTALRDRYTDTFQAQFDRNEVEDRSALRYSATFAAIHAEAMALPFVARLHHLCCMDYVARLSAKSGADPAADPRWKHHRAEARKLQKSRLASRDF